LLWRLLRLLSELFDLKPLQAICRDIILALVACSLLTRVILLMVWDLPESGLVGKVKCYIHSFINVLVLNWLMEHISHHSFG